MYSNILLCLVYLLSNKVITLFHTPDLQAIYQQASSLAITMCWFESEFDATIYVGVLTHF